MTTVGPLGVLVDRSKDRELASKGYVVVPFLERSLVDRLAAAALSTAGHDAGGLVIGFADPDRDVMRQTADVLESMWDVHLAELFIDHRVVVSTFITKYPGEDSAMAMHREPTFVDGSTRTFNAWIPLVDVDRRSANGVLWLVPGSEHLPQGLVGFNTPPLFRRYDRALRSRAVAVDVAAGSALVYDTRMLHWSDANGSGSERPAIAAALAPAEAPLIHVVATGRRHRRVHRVEPAFFVEQHPGSVAAGIDERWPLVRSCDDVPTLTPEEVGAAMGFDADDLPAPVTVLPADLEDGTDRRELHLATVAGAVLPESDVDDVGWPQAGAWDCSWLDGSTDGDAGVAELSAEPDPALGKDLDAGLRSLLGARRRGAVVRIAPRQRVVLRVGASRTVRLATYEAPELQAGIAIAGAAATLRPGTEVEVVGACEAVVWNDGPGTAWLVASTRADLSTSPDESTGPDVSSSEVTRPARRGWRDVVRRRRGPAGGAGRPAAPIG